LKANPFSDEPGAKVAVAFLDRAVAKRTLDGIVIPAREEIRPGKRVLYIHYPDGQGPSRLKLPPGLGVVTVRNINTVGKLAAMSQS
jgi:uncharacterized protein (DUF1697 family)